MLNTRTISLFTKDDYEKYAHNLTYSPTIGNNLFTYHESRRVVRVKSSEGTATGFRIPIFNMYRHDLVEVELEYRWLSGDSAGFLLYASGTVDSLNPNNKGEWDNLKLTFLLDKNYTDYTTANYIEIGGVRSTKSAEFEIKNVNIRFKSRKGTKFIIEEGTNGNGSWVKYSDGTMKCWGQRTFENVEINIASGSGFYAPSNQAPTGNYPQVFVDTPSWLATHYAVGQACWITTITQPGKSTLPDLNVFAFTSRIISKLVVSWEARGRWM